MSHIIILGNGIAGITAARHIRKNSDHRITVISGETDFFFSRTALMYIYMGHMKFEHTKPYEDHFWAKNKIELKKDWISSIDFEGKSLTGAKENYKYDQLVLALGSRPNKFGWPGQDLAGVQGLYSFQDLEKMEASTQGIKNAVVVGGGLIGVEMAEMLHARDIHVTYLVREKHFWDMVLPQEEAQMIDHHIRKQGIDLRLETELKAITDDGHGKVKAIQTTSGEVIPASFVGLTVGVSPNIDWLKSTTLETDRGILVDEYLTTNIPDVYAIGDCAQLVKPAENRKPIEAVWYTGRMMGETVAQTIIGKTKAYDPGIWFNSAKFFDIEYQTYGTVSTKESEKEKQFYWEAVDRLHAVRISYHPSTLEVIGINTLGIRMRHETWDEWIREGKKLQQVIRDLQLANFDPEFFQRFEAEIQSTFNESYPELAVPATQPSLLQRLFNA